MKSHKSRSLFRQNFVGVYRRSFYLRWWLRILIFLYFLSLFADCISPYTAQYENRAHSYAPPSIVHFVDEDGEFSLRPFIYARNGEYDEYRRKFFIEDTSAKHYLEFFSRGEEHYILGLIPTSLHLFGVDSDEPFYLLGADHRGRDIFSRILFGSRVSLTVGLVGALITFFLGTLIGCVAGYVGGRIDDILMRICEVILLVPSIYLLFALRALIPPTMSSVQMYFLIILILSLIGWAGLARVIRGMVLSLKEKEFILAARVLGQSPLQIIVKHIIPNLSSYLLISILFSVPTYILGESMLSFLGLGIQDPSVSWGNMLSQASNVSDLMFHPWILWPAFFLVLTVLSFNILADYLRDVLDPHYNKS